MNVTLESVKNYIVHELDFAASNYADSRIDDDTKMQLFAKGHTLACLLTETGLMSPEEYQETAQKHDWKF